MGKAKRKKKPEPITIIGPTDEQASKAEVAEFVRVNGPLQRVSTSTEMRKGSDHA